MRKRILKKIQKAQAQTMFDVEIVPRRPSRKDFVRRTPRDEDGNHIKLTGEIVLSHLHTDLGKTMTPQEQFKLSAFSQHGKMLRELRKQRQEGSEIGLDKKFEEDLGNV